MPALRYNPGLDGLRALAVFCVMLFHAQSPYAKGGFLGVDIFFVLSGYLITRIINEKNENGQFRYLEFYKNRAIRILPPLFLTALCTSILSGLNGITLEETRIIPSLLFYANIDLANNYSPAIFNHSWSLSLEEQFYILWPFTLLAAINKTQKPLLILIIFYFLASAWRTHLIALEYSWVEIYYRADTRISGLILGSALGLNLYKKAMPNPVVILSLLTIFAAVLNTEWGDTSSLAFAIPGVEIASAILITSLTNNKGIIYSAFSTQLIAKLGILSYSMYLWHYPIMFLIRDNHSPIHTFIIGATATILLSILTEKLVYKPITNIFKHNNSARNKKNKI